MTAEPVIITHALGRYPVHVEAGALTRLPELIAQNLGARRVALVADSLVYELYRSGRWEAAPWEGDALIFDPGEKSKTRESWIRLTDALLDRGFGRDSAVVALGGGVTGDLAGFVAATFMRGIPYLQVPTTTLAMLDASVGGKTGVDTPAGKNLVGSFHPPAAVIADPRTLVSLPDREYRAGLSEAVKHGVIADAGYFAWIESNAAALAARDLSALTHLIRRSVEIKGEVVAADERESGRRAILNAGHTVAHALEQASGFELPHGAAVSLGLNIECRLGEQLGIADPGLQTRVAALLDRLGLPTELPASVDVESMLRSMRADKKNRDGQIHFALVSGLGRIHRQPGWTTAVAPEAIRAALLAFPPGVSA